MPVLYEEVPVRRLLTGGTLGRTAPLAFITLTFEYGREFHGMRVLTAQGETNEFIKPVLRYYDYRNILQVRRGAKHQNRCEKIWPSMDQCKCILLLVVFSFVSR